MATAPTETKKRRSSGPRVVKDKQVILMFKGQLEGDVQVVFDPWEAMEAKDRDSTLQLKKVTIPVKRRASPSQAGAA